MVDCNFCERNQNRGSCPAFGEKCLKCGKIGHFKVRCRKNKASSSQEEFTRYTRVQTASDENESLEVNDIQVGLGLVDFWVNV